jgi:hypothetical protein
VALISSTIADHLQAVQESTVWNKSDELQAQAKHAVWRASLEAILVFLLLLIAFSIAIPLAVDPLDERMKYIVNGVSRLAAAVVLALLSIRVALWVGLYTPTTVRCCTERGVHLHTSLGTTMIELKFKVRWNISKKFLRSFLFLLVLLEESNHPASLPVSMGSGLGIGFVLDYGTYKARRLERARARHCASISLVVLFMICAIFTFGVGVFFIAAVWDDPNDAENTIWDVVATAMALVALPLIHVCIWQAGKRAEARERSSTAPEGGDNGSEESAALPKHHHPKRAKKKRMAVSLIKSELLPAITKVNEELNDDNLQNDVSEVGDDKEQEDNERLTPDDASGDEATNNDMQQETLPKTKEQQENEELVGDDKEMPPTVWQLMMRWQFCGCVRGDDKTISQKAFKAFNWFLYFVACLFCLFILIVNIGATYQQEAARKKLPEVNELLYKTMDEGPVCAFDNRGADSNITTFADKDAAHEAGFLVLHCGACGACSDWHNLELEYTTRYVLRIS